MRTVIIIISVLLLHSCTSQNCRETNFPQTQPVELPLVRLESKFYEASDSAEVEDLLRTYPDFSRYFLDVHQYPSLSLLAGKIYHLMQDPSIDTLYQEALSEFSDMEDLVTDLEGAVARLNTIQDENISPTIITAVTGLYSDLYISDSVIVVGIDYFIGPDGSYPPINVPYYLLRRYDKAHLVPVIAKFLASARITRGKGNTMLTEMIDFGKTYYLTSRILPCTPDSLIIGFSAEEVADVFAHESIIWASFVENKLLYETNHFIKQKFLGERPQVHEIGEKCPGRIGVWLGWQIVEAYMANNQVTIQELINETDNEKIFRLSGYKPKNN